MKIFFNQKKGRRLFSEKIRERRLFSTKKGGRRLFLRLIFPKTRPRYPVNFDRSLTFALWAMTVVAFIGRVEDLEYFEKFRIGVYN